MFRKVLIVLAACAMAPALASAQVIIGNMPPANDGTQTALINDQRQKAFRFTMGSMPAGAGDLILRLRGYDAFGEVNVSLRDFTGSTTAPGSTVLLPFTAPAPGGAGIMDYTFTPAGSFTLQPNTTYWLVVSGVPNGSFDWMASSPGITPTGMATHNQTTFTTNAGTSWSNSSILNTFEFQVIPEPASLGLVGGLGLLALGRRRNRLAA